MKRTLSILLLVAVVSAVRAQHLTLSFASSTDTKFYFFLNGKLQNDHSTGMLTMNNLEAKDYHIRIVADDPFQVAYTKTMKPSEKHNSYIVEFNPVKEKIFVREAKEQYKENNDSKQRNANYRDSRRQPQKTEPEHTPTPLRPSEAKAPQIHRVKELSDETE